MDIKFLQNESGAQIKGDSGDFVAVDMDDIKSFSCVISHSYSGSDSRYQVPPTTCTLVPTTSDHAFYISGYVYAGSLASGGTNITVKLDLVIKNESLQWRCKLNILVRFGSIFNPTYNQESEHYDYLSYSTGSLTFSDFDNMAGFDTTVSSVVLT